MTEPMVSGLPLPVRFWRTIKSAPAAPLIVPPVIVLGPAPALDTNRPPVASVKIMPEVIVTVAGPESFNVLIVAEAVRAKVALLTLMLLVGNQVARAVLFE